MEWIIINTVQCSEVVHLENIIYCKAEGSYTRVNLTDGRSVYCSKETYNRHILDVCTIRIW